MRIVQHRVKMNILDLGDGTDVTGNTLRHFDVFLALQRQQVRDLEGFPRIADEQLAVLPDRALVNAKHTEPAHERIDGDLEHVRNGMFFRVGADFDRCGIGAFALEEFGRIAFERVRHQFLEHIQQLFDADAGFGRCETDRHQVARTQGLFEGVVQLFDTQIFALLEIDLHDCFVDLDHLVDHLRVRRRDRGEIGVLVR